VKESGGPVRRERLLGSLGAERKNVKISAERPEGQVQSLGAQGGPDGRSDLRIRRDGAELVTAQKMFEVTKKKCGTMP